MDYANPWLEWRYELLHDDVCWTAVGENLDPGAKFKSSQNQGGVSCPGFIYGLACFSAIGAPASLVRFRSRYSIILEEKNNI